MPQARPTDGLVDLWYGFFPEIICWTHIHLHVRVYTLYVNPGAGLINWVQRGPGCGRLGVECGNKHEEALIVRRDTTLSLPLAKPSLPRMKPNTADWILIKEISAAIPDLQLSLGSGTGDTCMCQKGQERRGEGEVYNEMKQHISTIQSEGQHTDSGILQKDIGFTPGEPSWWLPPFIHKILIKEKSSI